MILNFLNLDKGIQRWRKKLTEVICFKKELSFCHNLKFSNFYISATSGCKPLIFQTYIIWPNIINSLKYLRSTTLACQDIGTRIFEFVAKTQFLWNKSDTFCSYFYYLVTWKYVDSAFKYVDSAFNYVDSAFKYVDSAFKPGLLTLGRGGGGYFFVNFCDT